MNHPRDNDLALLAGGDASRLQRFRLDRHVQNCADCQTKMAGYRNLRSELNDMEFPEVNWNFLATDMRANIRLGLEAGACVRSTPDFGRWNPRLGFAFAALALLLIGGEFAHNALHRPAAANVEATAPVLRMTDSGIEISTGSKSLALLNHHGNAANQTVSAQGDIGARYIDADTGAVTINNVYLQ
jgi:hypothetical protein